MITRHAASAWKHSAFGAVLLLIAAAAPAPSVPLGPVPLTSQPLSKLNATARAVAGQDIEDGGSGALLLLASQSLGTAGTGPALFVQVQSDRACGSAGCSVSIYLPGKAGWTKILDAVGTVSVLPTIHGGMHDMLVARATIGFGTAMSMPTRSRRRRST